MSVCSTGRQQGASSEDYDDDELLWGVEFVTRDDEEDGLEEEEQDD